MALYAQKITVPLSTPARAPLLVRVPIGEPIVNSVKVQFPRGCAGLVGVRLLDRSMQFAPLPAPGWIVADDAVIGWAENKKLAGSPFEISIELYNEDDTYPHVISVYVEANNENYWDGRRVY